MNEMQKKVEEFMLACDQHVNRVPQLPSESVVQLRSRLMTEELNGPGELLYSMDLDDLVGIADGLADLLYVLLGTASAYGIDIEAVFNEAHRSNMTKVGVDGKVEKDEYGKVMKPAGYSPARFHEVLVRLYERGRQPYVPRSVLSQSHDISMPSKD